MPFSHKKSFFCSQQSRFLEKEGKHKLRTPRILEDDVKLAKFSIERQNDGWKTSDGVVVLAAYEDLSKPDVSMEDVTTNIDSINAVLKSVARNVIAIAEKVSSSSSSSEEEEEEKIRKKRRHEVSPDEEPPKKKFKK